MPDHGELNRKIRAAFAAHRPPACTDLGEDSNFFEAGYTSVRLTAVVEALADDGVDLTLIDVFRYPTRRALSAEAARRHGGPQAPPSGGRRALPWETGPQG